MITKFGNSHLVFSQGHDLSTIPSHRTFNRVFSILKLKDFEHGLTLGTKKLYDKETKINMEQADQSNICS